jgi:hypothetical protein
VRQELVGQYRGVALDFDNVDRHRGHLGEHGAAQSVCEREIDAGQFEVDAVGFSLFGLK